MVPLGVRFVTIVLLFNLLIPVGNRAYFTPPGQDNPSRAPQATAPDPSVSALVNQVTPDALSQYARQLAGVDPIWIDGAWYTVPNRYTYGQQPIDKVTRYVGQHLLSLEQAVEYHVWEGDTYPNVIGEIAGITHPENVYIIGGHLDGVKGSPAADDNASGAAATLLIADILSQYQWGCTLRFAFWTGEEQWLLGSRPYAERSDRLNENILGYINLDMVGYNSSGTSPGVDIIYNQSIPQTLLHANTFVDVVDTYQFQIEPEIISDLSADSDHYAFWENGFPAILVMEDQADWNPDYHTANDTIAQMDFGFLTEVTKASLATFLHTSNCLLPSTVLSITGVTQTQIGLSWTDGSTDESDYHIERSPDGVSNWVEIATPAANTTSYTDTSLACDTAVYYRIRAHWHSDSRFSEYSNIVTAETSSCSPPQAPGSLSASAISQTQINLSWTDNAADESDFHIERSPDGLTNWTEIATVGANAATYPNSGLACGSTFHYRVRAHRHSDGLYSSYSTVAHATTAACPPAAPGSLSASAISQTQIDLSWADNAADESDFHIERSPDGLTNWTEIATVGANAATYPNSGLVCGSTFHYRVRAHRHGDGLYSSYSTVAHANTAACPPLLPCPSGLVVSENWPISLHLTWVDHSSDETSFHVERFNHTAFTWEEIATLPQNATSYLNSELLGHEQLFRVRAYRASDNVFSDYSETVTYTPIPHLPPSAPTELTAQIIPTEQIELQWKDNSSDETHFYLERSLGDETHWTVIRVLSSNTTLTRVEGLPGETYYFRIRAYRSIDQSYSDYSNQITAFLPTPWQKVFLPCVIR